MKFAAIATLFSISVPTLSMAQSTALTASIAPKQLQSDPTIRKSDPQEEQLRALNRAIQEKEKKIARLQNQLRRSAPANHGRREKVLQASVSDDAILDPASVGGVPYQAKAGQCYAKVEKSEGEYKVTTEKELVREAYTKVRVIPAKFSWVDEKITIEEPAEDLVRVPAQYKTVQEKILVRDARTVWKKGAGLPVGAKILEKKKGQTDVLCLVEEPPLYQTVSKRVLVAPEHVKKVSLPGKYKTIRVKKLAEPAREETVEVPAEYREVSKKVALKDPQYAWTRVVCETNLTPKNIEAIQVALKNKDAYHGPVNGRIDPGFMAATLKFAQDRGLPHDGKFIAMEVIDALNIKL